MKTFVLIRLFVVVAATKVPSETDILWETFKTKFNKNYEVSEEISRRAIWEENLQFIAVHNHEKDLGLHSYSLGINRFSDMSHEEFSKKMLNGLKRDITKSSKSEYMFNHTSDNDLPETVDWRNEGFVSEVKNQGECGCCWAFAATGALEGQQKKKTGKLVSLSEQYLVDCCFSHETDACRTGGYADLAFKCIELNGGISTEESYPYEAMKGLCKFQPEFAAANCIGFVDIPSKNEDALKLAVATIGPISATVEASKKFQSYKKGVLDDPSCRNKIDHAVLVVGYGTENGNDYWLVKNSWGPDWGKKGYIKMSRNKKNQCGIASQASYPLID